MSLDAVKMFFQNERNKLIGVGVAACLITTAIVAPAAYFGGQPSYKGVVSPVAFNRISATGGHLADYGSLAEIEDQDGWGNEDNISYVTTDRDLTANVIETKDAIGFQALNVAEKEAIEIKTDESYELNVMGAQFDPVDAEGKTTYVKPGADGYELVAPINVYMRVPAPVSIFFKENLMSEKGAATPTIWEEDWNKGTSAGVHKDGDLANVDALKGYGEWVKQGHGADLLMAYTFFNWMLFVENTIGDYPPAPEEAANPDSIGSDDFAEYVNIMLENVVGDSIETEQYKEAKVIAISGTGTADPYTQDELDLFNEFLKQESTTDGKIPSLSGVENTDVSINLTNQGSGTAWYMPGGDGIEFDAGDDNNWTLKQTSAVGTTVPSNDAFIGTQSRRSYFGSYGDSISGMSQWGYGYQHTDAGKGEWNYMEQPTAADLTGDDPAITSESFGASDKYKEAYANEQPWQFTESSDIEADPAITDTDYALPLGFTATTDPLVFFTANDTTFKHEEKDDHPKGTYKPTGMTPTATKLIFENPLQQDNITWDMLFSAGLIDAVEV